MDHGYISITIALTKLADLLDEHTRWNDARKRARVAAPFAHRGKAVSPHQSLDGKEVQQAAIESGKFSP